MINRLGVVGLAALSVMRFDTCRVREEGRISLVATGGWIGGGGGFCRALCMSIKIENGTAFCRGTLCACCHLYVRMDVCMLLYRLFEGQDAF